MNINTYPNPVKNLWNDSQVIDTATVELANFDIGIAYFGLPIFNIDRIVNLNNTNNNFNSQLAGVEILDLHHQLFGMSLSDPTTWIIIKNLDDRSYVIPTDTLPTLTYVSIDRIRILPDDFRTTNPLGIATHIAMVGERTTFILTDRSLNL
jgi:purine-binding chemotaxis protein CheW